ncbi:MAG: hypothetical protein ACJAU1_001726 [Psychromonas sp.]|jgi:hypothetical protein
MMAFLSKFYLLLIPLAIFLSHNFVINLNGNRLHSYANPVGHRELHYLGSGKQVGVVNMQKIIINKPVDNELQGQSLSEEKEWAIAVNKSKEKYKLAARQKNKFVGEKIEYFNDTKTYDETKGSDFDDYYN